MKRNKWFFFLIILLFSFSRVIFLESDLPSQSISRVNSLDQLYDASIGFNLYNHGTFVDQTLPYAKIDIGPLSLFGPTLTGVTLSIFGNNFYGLKMAIVLISILTLILLYLIFSHIQTNEESKQNLIVFYGLIMYVVLDCMFLILSRTMLPIGFRIFIITLILYLFTIKDKFPPTLFYFIIGFSTAFSFLFIYIYNFFILPSSLLAILFFHYQKNKSIYSIHKPILLFGTGVLLCLFFLELTCRIGFDNSMVYYVKNNLLQKVQTRTDIISSEKPSRIITIIKSISGILTANMFRFNPSLLIVSLLSLIHLVGKSVKYRKIDSLSFFIFLSLFFLFLQLQFENTYPAKRLNILFPFFIIMIYQFLIDFKKITLKKLLITTPIFLLLAVIYFKNPLVSSLYKEIPLLNIINSISVILLIFVFVFFKKSQLRNGFITIVLMISALFLDFKLIYLNPEYKMKNTMVDLAKHINGEVVMAGKSYAFRLYNTSQPVFNMYRYQGKKQLDTLTKRMEYYVENDLSKYIISYGGGNTPNHLHKQASFLKNIEVISKYQVTEKDSIYLYKINK